MKYDRENLDHFEAAWNAKHPPKVYTLWGLAWRGALAVAAVYVLIVGALAIAGA